MRTFLTIISWLWILIILVGNIPRLANYNLSSSNGVGALIGSLLAIGLLASPAVWYLARRKKVKKNISE